ncbi:hypothetical protein PFICI_05340 [Pestalotiopsis fici W106-1]|uniref:Chitin deacetylase n=1 Tax=Pestalotiopsis fici (strain W106-1 / CGMCC3.15140) TaxID=1229662 RepID=W3XBR2_PESFW|nr:uncharacterized protein PFICI_05340 [Pestalotiopsis fici W106-1]ETS83464.1 hypothetical protein PFICI_05340 [Pestalotiopsis fici W106-1]
MRWITTVLLVGLASLSAAHDEGPVPKFVGGRKLLSGLKSRRALERKVSGIRMPHVSEDLSGPTTEDETPSIDARDNTSGKCGPNRGSCAAGYCCSVEGWCGLGIDYCEAPDCQLSYGPGCDGNSKPSGVDTSTIARPKVGNVEYGGVGIYDCVNAGDIAMTFDDGPWNYTSDLLDKLQKYNAKATFFIAGNNIGKGHINDPSLPWRAVIQRMAAEGHQVASHTWSHQNFSDVTATQARNQVLWNEIALNDILGYIPTYLRPPFSICESDCEDLLAELGYHIIYFDLDTEGYLYDDPADIQICKDIWNEAVDNSDACDDNFLHIEHDIHWQSVYNLTDYFLASLFENNYRAVTVGECLGDPPENWYRAGSSSVPAYDFPSPTPTNPAQCAESSTSKRGTGTDPSPTGGLVVSEEGDCGNGVTCLGSEFGNCCSQYGFCGNTTDYCGKGCQPAFGSGCLGASSSVSTTTSATATTTSPSTTTSTGVSTSPPSTTATTTTVSTPAPVPPPSTTSLPGTTTTRRSTSTSSTSSAAAPTGTNEILVPSKDGSCGKGTGYTCLGSDFGLCCTSGNRCALLCLLTGCQPDYGTCAVLIGPE